MTPSEPQFKTPSPQLIKGIALAFLLLALAGFLDATYLTVDHYLRLPVPCSAVFSCETVLTSRYSQIFGVPVSLAGVLYYGAIFLLSLAALSRKNEKLLRAVAQFTPIGFIASLVFIYLQFFVIHAICIYCMISAALSITLFCIGFVHPQSTGRQSLTKQRFRGIIDRKSVV